MELSEEELSQRVAIVRRFKSLLEQQRKAFADYLRVLELHSTKIEAEDADAILEHTQLEERIVSNIGTLQKCIIPMEKMYAGISDGQISKIQTELSVLNKKIQVQSEKNRSLLKTHLTSLKQQLFDLKNPYRNARSVYAGAQALGSFVQINA